MCYNCSVEYILSQVFVILSYTFLAATYLTKKRKWILFFSIVAVVFNGVSYFFLKAWAGLGVTAVALLRNIIFMIQEKVDKIEEYMYWDYLILAFLVGVTVTSAVLTYNGFFSLFTTFASLAYTVSIWQKNITVYEILGVVSCVFSLAYYAFIGSFFGIILESALMIVEIIGTIKYFKEKRNQEAKEVSENGIG